MRFAAYSHDPRLRIGDATRIKLFTADTVNDMPLGVSDFAFRHGANDVDLVIFARKIAAVDIDNMIRVVESKHRIGFIPMDIVNFSAFNCGDDCAEY